jgi:PAS domain S-box-containing protein/diguanylate cyclase (GGDEF)-like protein
MDKVRMLVVEDERIVSMDLQRRLKAMGYEIAGAAVSGEEAIEKAEKLRPDMVLMDIMLDGELDGTQAAEIIRSRFNIPVIYLTAYADSATLERAKITEPFGYILKPFEERELHGHIEIALYKARMEKKLKDSEERYVLATMGANDGLWDWDLKSQSIYFSPRWKSMLGYNESEIGHHPREWFSRLHPEDRSRVKQQVAAHITGKAQHFESEYRILCKDGSYRWALTRGLALIDANGKAQRIAGSQTDITERKLYEPLTGLPNRILFADRIQSTLDRGRSDSSRFAVLSIKIVDFKEVANGHNGDRDELFLQIAERAKEVLREGDTLAHIGEETLGALIVNVRDPSEANSLAARVLENLNRPFCVDVQRVYFQSSIGIAWSGGYFSSEDLLRDSATAMGRASLSGRSGIEVFDEKMRHHVAVRVQKESDLRRAIEREEFQVYYQPIVSLDSGKLAGFEALVRWAHRDGLRLPADFIPLAEDTGLIIPIERFVLQNAIKQMREWNARLKLGPEITMSVNLSPQHYSEPDLVDEVKELLAATGFDPRMLKLEITESALMRDTEAVSRTLAQLDELNIKLAMDDFGTGYSSLSALHQFPIKTLKIDRCFVSNLGRRTESRKIVQAIVSLGRNLGMDVTAEGVENERQIVELQAFDCSHAQGFLFSKPMSREETSRLLAERKQWFTEGGIIVEDGLLVGKR